MSPIPRLQYLLVRKQKIKMLEQVKSAKDVVNMFSLVKFHNGKYLVVASKKVKKANKNTCVVNCNGGKYSGFIISKSDDKSKLLNIKQKEEEMFFSSSKHIADSFCNAGLSSTPKLPTHTLSKISLQSSYGKNTNCISFYGLRKRLDRK